MEVIILIATLIFVAAFMFGLFYIGDMTKDKEPKNNVRFFVTKDSNYTNRLKLWLGKPEWSENVVSWITRSKYVHFICNDYYFKFYKLNPEDFADMKEGEIREAYLDLED